MRLVNRGNRPILDIVLVIIGIFFLIGIFYFASKQALSPTLLFIGLVISCVLITLSIVHFVKTGHPIIHGRRREYSFDRVTHRDHVSHKNIVLVVLFIISVIVLFNLNSLSTITGLAIVEHTSLGEFGMGWTGRNVFASEGAVQIDLSEYLFHVDELNMTFSTEPTSALQAHLTDSLLSLEFTSTSERENILWIVAEDSLGNKRRFDITIVYLLKRDIVKENAIALLRAENPIIGDAYEYVPIVEPIVIPKTPVVEEPVEEPVVEDPVVEEPLIEELGPEQSFFDGIDVKDDLSRKVGTQIKNDLGYETLFHNVDRTAGTLTIIFSHNAETSLPVWVEKLESVDYTLTTENAQPEENVTLVVQLKKNKIPKFNLHVGEDSDVFEFWDNGFEAQAALICSDVTPGAGQTYTVSVLTDCVGSGGPALTVLHSGTILELDAELRGDPEQDVVTIGASGELTINNLGSGSIVHVGSAGDAVYGYDSSNFIFTGPTLPITGNIRGSSGGGTTITGIDLTSGGIFLYGATNRITSTNIDSDQTLKLTSANDVIVNDFIGGSINVDPSFDITIANTTLANTDNCLIIDNSSTVLVYNVTFANCSVNAINITNGSMDNVIRNNTFLNNSVGVGIYNGTNNTIYWNNFTNLSTPFNAFIFDNVSFANNNSLNTSVGGVPQGNQYADITGFSIFDSSGDTFGDTGGDYPYGWQSGSTIIGNITGNITDFGPWYPTAPALSACDNITQDAILTTNIVAPTLDTCILLNASGITLDCRGFSIIGNSSGIGIGVDNKTGIIIKDCHVDNFTRGMELNNTNHSFVQNNTASNNSYAGIQMNYCINNSVYWNTFTNNTVLGFYGVSTNDSNLTQNIVDLNLNNPFRFELSSNNILTHNVIRDNRGSSSGVYLSDSTYFTLYNNTMYNNGLYGIYLLGSNYNNVTNNTVYNNSIGIYLTGSNNNISYNTVYNNTAHGFQTSGGNGDNLFVNNSAFNNTQMGYLISGSHNNMWINNTAYNNTRIGFSITNAHGNNFTECTAYSNQWDGFRFITTVQPGAENNTLTECSAWNNSYADLNVTGQVGAPSYGIYLNDSVFSSYGFDQAGIIIENSSAGILRYLNESITESGDNFSLDIRIKNNSVYVNGSGQPGLNTTANITLFGITGFTGHPNIFVDRNDDGAFEEECVEPDCYNLSYSGSTFIFNTTHFTEFIASSIVCGATITENTTLTKNLTGTTTCITIGAHNVELDCDGYALIGNYSTNIYGIFVNGKENVTIKNCYVEKFGDGIFFNNTNSSLVDNCSAINNSVTGIKLTYGIGNNFTDNIAHNNSNYGIDLAYANSSRAINNTLMSNGREGLFVRGSLSSNSYFDDVINNTITYNSWNGLVVDRVSNSTFDNNIIMYNLWSGCLFDRTNYSVFSSNIVNNNTWQGAYVRNNNHNNYLIGNSFSNNSQEGLYFGATFDNNISHNLLNTNGYDGLSLNQNNDNLFVNNTANFNGWDGGAYEGFLSSKEENNTWISNTANNNSDYGFYLWSITGIVNLNMSHNIANGNSPYNGFYIETVNNGVFFNNTANNNGAEGFYFWDVDNTKMLENYANNNGIDGFLLESVDNSTLTLSTAQDNTNYDIHIASSSANVSLNDSTFYRYNFDSAGIIIINNSAGELRFLNQSITQNGTNLTQDVQITNNSIFINSTNAPGLNVSANLTFYNINYVDPVPSVDYNDDGTFAICPASDCTELEYTGTTYTYNATHFSTFRTGEGPFCGQNLTADTTLIADLFGTGNCFNITAGNITLDCAGYSIIGNGSGFGIKIYNVDNVTVKDCTVGNFTTNLDIDPSVNNTIGNNTFQNATNCIVLNETNNTLVINNSLWNCTYGIRLDASFDNNITNNTVNETARGIWIANQSRRNRVFYNTVENIVKFGTSYGIHVELSHNNTIGYNILRNHTRSGSGIYIDRDNTKLCENNTVQYNTLFAARYIEASGSDFNIIEFNNISNSQSWGILVGERNHIVRNNTVKHGFGALDLVAEFLNISGNIIFNNTNYGIWVEANNINMYENTIYNNSKHGIFIDDKDGNNMTDNIIYNNTQNGISIEGAAGGGTNNLVISNTIHNNTRSGVYIFNDGNDFIIDNNITSNSWSGIFLESNGVTATSSINITGNIVRNNSNSINLTDADSNTIYNNYFENPPGADSASTGNSWDITKVTGANIIGGPYIAGNFWVNYNGTDNTGDQIGDTEVPWYGLTSGIVNGGDNQPLYDTYVQAIRCEYENPDGNFVACSATNFSSNLTRIGVNCTDTNVIDGIATMSDATINLTNLDDGTNFAYGLTTTQEGGYFVLDHSDVQILDSGIWQIEAICNDTTNTSNRGSTQFTIAYGNLTAALMSVPMGNANVTADQTFSASCQIECSGGECVNITVTLDPLVPNTNLTRPDTGLFISVYADSELIYGATDDDSWGDGSDRNVHIWNKADLSFNTSLAASASLRDVYVDSMYIYAVGKTGTLAIYDRTDSSTPFASVATPAIPNSSSTEYGVRSDDDYIYVGGGGFNSGGFPPPEFGTIFIFNKTTLTNVINVTWDGGTVRGLAVDSNFLYAATHTCEVLVYNKTDWSMAQNLTGPSGCSQTKHVSVDANSIISGGVGANSAWTRVWNKTDYSLLLDWDDETVQEYGVTAGVEIGGENSAYYGGRDTGWNYGWLTQLNKTDWSQEDNMNLSPYLVMDLYCDEDYLYIANADQNAPDGHVTLFDNPCVRIAGPAATTITIASIATSPSQIPVSSSVTCSANVTTTGTIDTVRFNITYPDGTTLVLSSSNVSSVHNSTAFDVNSTGDYNCTVDVNTTDSTLDSSTLNFYGGNKGVIPMNAGSPFYTISQNPRNGTNQSCLNSTLPGQVCNSTWNVTTNGTVGDTWAFFCSYEGSENSLDTQKANVTISEASAPPVPEEEEEVAAVGGRSPGGGGEGWDPRYASATTVHGIEEPEVQFEEPEVQKPSEKIIEEIIEEEIIEEEIIEEEIIEEAKEETPYVFEKPITVESKYWWFWIIVLIVIGLGIHRMKHYAEGHPMKLPIPQLKLSTFRKLKLRTKRKIKSKVKKPVVKKKLKPVMKPKVQRKLKKIIRVSKLKKIKKKLQIKPRKEKYSKKNIDKLLKDIDKLLKNV